MYSEFQNKKSQQLKKEAVLYYKQGLSLRKVAKLVGKSYGWVHLAVKEVVPVEKRQSKS